MADVDHNKVLAEAARQTLRPLGLRRKGRSRTWLDDHDWWLLVVEFQPSSWSRGSYLNVGPMWLWFPAGPHLHFDVFGRVEPFIGAEDEEQWSAAAARLAQAAAAETQKLRETITDPAAAALFIEAAGARGHASHPDLNGGIAHGLAGQWGEAETLLHAFIARAAGFPDPGPLLSWGQRLLECVRHPEFAETIRRCVEKRRGELSLDRRVVSFGGQSERSA
jgi:uncharacterized protein DUF4304